MNLIKSELQNLGFKALYPWRHAILEKHIRSQPVVRREAALVVEEVRADRAAAQAAADKLARDVRAIDVSDHLPLTDVFVLASAPNDRQVRAIVDAVEDKLREAGAKPVRREGEREGRWVLIDFIDIVVHVQHEEERDFYGLERLWKDCPLIALALDEPEL